MVCRLIKFRFLEHEGRQGSMVMWFVVFFVFHKKPIPNFIKIHNHA